jgi:fructokinase
MLPGQTYFFLFLGGSPFNTAIALDRLNVDVGFLAGISTDFFGGVLVSHLGDFIEDKNINYNPFKNAY